MTITELGAIGELVGGVAVIASLVYVGVQVRQNTRAQNTAAGDATVANLMEIQNSVARDSDLARIVMSGGADASQLALDDRFRFNLLGRSMFIQYDIARIKRERGLLEDSLWHTSVAFFDDALSAPGIRWWWDRNLGQFSPAMQDFVRNRKEAVNASFETARVKD